MAAGFGGGDDLQGLPVLVAVPGQELRGGDEHRAGQALACGQVLTSGSEQKPLGSAWYLVTNLPRPGGPREPDSPHPAATLAGITRIYGIRNWTGQSYKQVKDELGWADFQVRSDIAIRRHQVLVNCAFSFCRDTWSAHPPPPATPPAPGAGDGERGAQARQAVPAAVLAPGAAGRTSLAGPVDHAATLVDRMVQGAPVGTLDASVRLAATMAVTALASLVLLLGAGWSIVLALIPLSVAALAYNAAVRAALAFAETVHVAFDLHRADLLTALRMDLPGQREAERILNERWCDHWRQGIPLPPTGYDGSS